MICTKCGDEMNHHADKLIYSTETNARARTDPSLGGLIEETHHAAVAAPSPGGSWIDPGTNSYGKIELEAGGTLSFL